MANIERDQVGLLSRQNRVERSSNDKNKTVTRLEVSNIVLFRFFFLSFLIADRKG